MYRFRAWQVFFLSMVGLAACGGEQTEASLTSDITSARADRGKIYYFGYTEADADDPQGMKDNGITQITRIGLAIADRPRFGGARIKSSGGYAALTNGLDWLAGNATNVNDTAVIYLHTHGSPQKMTVPNMTWADLRRRVQHISAGNVLLFVSTCNSGAATDTFARGSWNIWSNRRQNVGVFSAVDVGETSAFYRGPPPINPLSDNVINKINANSSFTSLYNLPYLVRRSYASYGQNKNPQKATHYEVGRTLW